MQTTLGQDALRPAAQEHTEDYRAFYDAAPCGFLTMRRDGTILGVNRTLIDWTGRDPEDTGAVVRLRDILTPAGWVVYSLKAVPVITMHGRVNEIALDLRRTDGSALPVLASFRRVDCGDDEEPVFRGMLFNATERRLYERELLAARKVAEEAGARVSSVLEATTDGALLVGSDWRVSYANARAAQLLNARPVGADLREAFPADEDRRFLAVFENAKARREGEGVQASIPDGRWLSVTAHPAPGGGVAVFFRDCTSERNTEEERRRAGERIQYMATHDALTGLPNRTLFAARLRDALALSGGGVAVLALDLDRFKQVNDRLGHPAGDALLRAVAGRLRSELRPEDTVARFGGDEFAVVLCGAARGGQPRPEADAEAVAMRVVRALSAPFALRAGRAEIGTSVGIALSAGRDMDPEALLAEADVALYEAKRAGRGRHALFRPAMLSEQRARLDVAGDLRQALERGEVLVHYQPFVDVATRAVRGHEALVRWQRPGHGLVQPASFIPVAEEAGLIVRLGAFILEQACQDAAAWPDRTLRVAVNLSPLQLRDGYLVETVTQALRRSGLDPRRLELEITEGVMLDRADAVLDTMHRLRAMGIAFAMDDFGTGYSSLASLRAFPFERVKIDRSFVREAETREDDAAIVEAVAALAWRLGMACTAEGVETEGQLRLLARSGCAEAQGYLFGRPIPQAQLVQGMPSGN